jgi:uncharacterized protein (DUF427 family)
MPATHDDHPIRVELNQSRIRVRFAGRVIADTRRALTLFEASYPGVRYIPVADVDMALLSRSSHKTQCPFKGEASYYTIASGARTAENAVWSYERPKPVAAAIAGYLAFDLKRVDGIEETPA